MTLSQSDARTLVAASSDRASHVLREPTEEDGQAVWQLISSCPPLDENSMYCNILQCSHFADTCVVAERDGVVEGWLSAYRPPGEPETIFIWQVAVNDAARGQGLGKTMIRHLLARPLLVEVSRIKATITPDNRASWRLFEAVADLLGAPLTREEWLRREQHFGGRHESEVLITIGPFDNAARD